VSSDYSGFLTLIDKSKSENQCPDDFDLTARSGKNGSAIIANRKNGYGGWMAIASENGDARLGPDACSVACGIPNNEDART
jgi:hypothetical protein